MKGDVVVPRGDGGRQPQDSGGGAGPGRKRSWYEKCFPIKKEPGHFQPREGTSRHLPEQTALASSGHRGEASTSGETATQRQADHGEAAQEKLSIKQLVDNRLKELEKTSGQTGHLLSEIQKACDELRGSSDIDQLADKIVKVSNAVSTEICERSQTLQSAYKRFEKDGEGLEEIGRYSQEVHKRVQQTIGERFLRLQDDCNELRETKDLLKTLRDFPHVWKQIDEAKADLSKSAEGNTKIKELSNRIIEKVENSRNKLHNKIVNVSESNIKEFLDNSWRLQGVWDKLKEDVNQLETLRKASREWKEARQIKEEFIGTLSEKSKGAAGMRAEMADTAFALFLSYFEQKDTRQGDKTRLEKACEQLKGIVADDLKHKWKMLTESHKVLYKDHENLATSMQETTATYGQFAIELGKENFTEARNRVGQLAKDILKYEFKPKEVKPSRRTQAVDRLRKLLRMTRDHRPGRVNKVAGEFNDTLEKVKEKLAAVPEEVKDKILESTIAIMKDFKESYDNALRGYGKRKGRTARGEGETKIKEFNSQLNALNDALSSYKQIQDIHEALRDPYQEIAKKAVDDANHAFEQLLNRRENWQSLKERIEGACGRLADIVQSKIERDNKEVSINKRIINSDGIITDGIDKISMDIESCIISKKDIIKEIASATIMGGRRNKVKNEDSSYISEHGGGVFDGVSQGGHGAEASQMAKEFFERELPKLSDKIKREKFSPEQIEIELKKITYNAHNEINNKINNYIQNEDKKANTTLSAVIPIGDGKMMAVNVGDSRVYVLRKDGELKHITTDDSAFENPDFYNEGNRNWYMFTPELYKKMNMEKPDKQEQKMIQKKIAKMDDNQIREIKERVELEKKVIEEKCSFDDLWAKLRNEEDFEKRYEIQNEIERKKEREIKNLSESKSLEEMKIEFAIKCGNLIGQSLGVDEVEPNIVTFDIKPDDRIIITSDGVHDNLSDQEIIDCISNSRTAEEAAQALVKTALEKSLDQTRSRRKPGDDTTAVVVECPSEGRNDAKTFDKGKDKVDVPLTRDGQEKALSSIKVIEYSSDEDIIINLRDVPSTSPSQETDASTSHYMPSQDTEKFINEEVNKNKGNLEKGR